MKIGVFDSGVGGLSMANAIKIAFPQYEVIVREDRENLPYGTKTPEQLVNIVTPILEQMVEDGCDVIVIACNTVTTNIIGRLREAVSVPLVGLEPMVKPAANITKSKSIAVFATPATLASERYKYLKQNYCKNIAIFEPDCSDWASMIEGDRLQINKITKNVSDALQKQADVIVLGCTHYHWIEELISSIAGKKARVLQPEQAVVSRLRSVIEQLD